MTTPNSLLIGGRDQKQVLMNTRMANRHGMIAGATGTGKTVTMQILAEEFSRAGVPVFMADVKGDVSGLACQATAHPKIDERIEAIGITDYQMQANPVVFWDLYGKKGHPVRATISELGPLLLSNLLELNETQTGVLYAAFKIADEHGLLLLDLEDLPHQVIQLQNRFSQENLGILLFQNQQVTLYRTDTCRGKVPIIPPEFGSIIGHPAQKMLQVFKI